MYYEVHLTTYPFGVQKAELFEKTCKDAHARFTMIELGRGETKMQPMATYISFDPYTKVLEQIIKLNFLFQKAGFCISRSKTQYPAQYYPQVKDDPNLEFIYFESHIKVGFTPETHQQLRSIGVAHRSHLSTNPLAKSTDQKFLTLRQYEQDYKLFDERVEALKSQLEAKGFKVFKTIKEVCNFDSNQSVDKGWLE